MDELQTNRFIDRLVNSIEDDISDRNGIGDEWHAMDKDIREEIRARWAWIIKRDLILANP
jgi:hypothetical protein